MMFSIATNFTRLQRIHMDFHKCVAKPRGVVGATYLSEEIVTAARESWEDCSLNC
jgi:hypothetical protein